MLREALSLSALVTGWYAVWCAIPEAAQAATRAEVLDNPAILLLGLPFFAVALGLTVAMFFLLRKPPLRKAPEMFPDPEQDRPIKYEDFRQ